MSKNTHNLSTNMWENSICLLIKINIILSTQISLIWMHLKLSLKIEMYNVYFFPMEMYVLVCLILHESVFFPMEMHVCLVFQEPFLLFLSWYIYTCKKCLFQKYLLRKRSFTILLGNHNIAFCRVKVFDCNVHSIVANLKTIYFDNRNLFVCNSSSVVL